MVTSARPSRFSQFSTPRSRDPFVRRAQQGKLRRHGSRLLTGARVQLTARPVRVLAMDTSTELGSVAVLIDGALAAEVGARVRARHGETLLPLVRGALDRAGLAVADVDLIAVGIGPGSFTGTRVGVATAKGLAVALDRPLVGVVSLAAIARGAPGAWVVPVVDAHKGEVYVAAYERVGAALEERMAPFHAPPAEAFEALRARVPREGAVLCGSGLRRYPEHVDPALTVLPPLFDSPRAAIVALEAEERFRAAGADDRATLEPLYVRPSDAVLPAQSDS